MARGKKSEKKTAKNGANLGFEQTLWQAADKLRGNMDASDYKHVVLGLIFLKYISDAFEERHAVLKSEPTPILKIATNTLPKTSSGFQSRSLAQAPGRRQAARHRQTPRRSYARHGRANYAHATIGAVNGACFSPLAPRRFEHV